MWHQRLGLAALLLAGSGLGCDSSGTAANADAGNPGSEPSDAEALDGGGPAIGSPDATMPDATTSDATGGGLDGSPGPGADAQPLADAPSDAPIDAACSTIGLSDDSHNCGACGADCGAGVCSAAHCTTILATRVDEPQGIAVDGTNVYVATSDQFACVYAIPLAGGSPAAIITPTITPHVLNSTHLTLAASKVFWTAGASTDEVFSVPTAGGAATTISTGEMLPGSIATDGTTVFWTDGTRIRYAPVSTQTPATLNVIVDASAAFDTPTAIAVDGTYVYWANQGSTQGGASLWRANKTDGSGVQSLVTGPVDPIRGITLDASNVYFTSDYSNVTHGVYSVPIGGGAATPLATTEQGPTAITSDANAIYWIDGGNRIRKMVKGGAITTLATYTGYVKSKIAEVEDASAAFLSAQGAYTFLTVDSTYVYWTDNGGAVGAGYIAKVPKN